MVSFVQQVEGAKDVGIGDNRIYEQDSRGQAYAIRGAAESFANLVEDTRSFVGAKKGIEAVRSAQKQVDTEVAEMDELVKLDNLSDPSVDQLKRKVQLLEKGVRQGKISQENARLRVSDLVTQSIQQNPLFADKIRESAGNLLGFDPKSEAAQQFFSAFDTEAEISAKEAQGSKESPMYGQGTMDKIRLWLADNPGKSFQDAERFFGAELSRNAEPKTPALSAREERVEFLSKYAGISKETAGSLIAQGEILELEQAKLNADLKNGALDQDRYIASTVANDLQTTQYETLRQAVLMREGGQEVNVDTLRLNLDATSQALKQRMLLELKQQGPLTTEAIEKVNKAVDDQINNTVGMISRMDSSYLTKKNLERVTVANQRLAYDILPQAMFIHDTFGPATHNTLIEAVAASGGNPEKLKALISVSPGAANLFKIYNTDPKQFNGLLMNTFKKLGTPGENITTQEEAATIDFILNQMGSAEPTSKNPVVEALFEKGMNTKASSVMANMNPKFATPENKTAMKQQWDLAKTVATERAAEAVVSEYDEEGFKSEVSVVNGQLVFKPKTGAEPASSIPGADNLAKINLHLKAMDKGWGSVYGVLDKEREARRLADEINSKMDASRKNVFDKVMNKEASKVSDWLVTQDTNDTMAKVEVKDGKLNLNNKPLLGLADSLKNVNEEDLVKLANKINAEANDRRSNKSFRPATTLQGGYQYNPTGE